MAVNAGKAQLGAGAGSDLESAEGMGQPVQVGQLGRTEPGWAKVLHGGPGQGGMVQAVDKGLAHGRGPSPMKRARSPAKARRGLGVTEPTQLPRSASSTSLEDPHLRRREEGRRHFRSASLPPARAPTRPGTGQVQAPDGTAGTRGLRAMQAGGGRRGPTNAGGRGYWRRVGSGQGEGSEGGADG